MYTHTHSMCAAEPAQHSPTRAYGKYIFDIQRTIKSHNKRRAHASYTFYACVCVCCMLGDVCTLVCRGGGLLGCCWRQRIIVWYCYWWCWCPCAHQCVSVSTFAEQFARTSHAHSHAYSHMLPYGYRLKWCACVCADTRITRVRWRRRPRRPATRAQLPNKWWLGGVVGWLGGWRVLSGKHAGQPLTLAVRAYRVDVLTKCEELRGMSRTTIARCGCQLR